MKKQDFAHKKNNLKNREFDKQTDIFDELIENQKKHLLKEARRIIPYLTEDDLLQPNDFMELEFNPLFRYEEGVLHGYQAAKAAFLAKDH